jgi:hypothetical protein
MDATDWLWIAVSLLVVVVTVCVLRLMALSKLLRAQRMERMWRRWRCHCGRRMYDNRTMVADGRGMLHGAAECVPDVSVLHP